LRQALRPEIWKVGWSGVKDKWPGAYAAIKAFTIDNDEMGAMITKVDLDGKKRLRGGRGVDGRRTKRAGPAGSRSRRARPGHGAERMRRGHPFVPHGPARAAFPACIVEPESKMADSEPKLVCRGVWKLFGSGARDFLRAREPASVTG
jgi:hypothetical protein